MSHYDQYLSDTGNDYKEDGEGLEIISKTFWSSAKRGVSAFRLIKEYEDKHPNLKTLEFEGVFKHFPIGIASTQIMDGKGYMIAGGFASQKGILVLFEVLVCWNCGEDLTPTCSKNHICHGCMAEYGDIPE